jgi:hypothetical protein
MHDGDCMFSAVDTLVEEAWLVVLHQDSIGLLT